MHKRFITSTWVSFTNVPLDDSKADVEAQLEKVKN